MLWESARRPTRRSGYLMDPTMPAERASRARKYPLCDVCGQTIFKGAGVYLFSIIDSRNYGPFHGKCAENMTEEQDGIIRGKQYPERYNREGIAWVDR
jgi:hypothetical protein